MQIKGLTNSFIDYPDNICITVFIGGCNYRCPFCQNPDLVLTPDKLETIPLEKALARIATRKSMIDGVTITGGEPLINEDIRDLIGPVKEMGLKVKLDTNGSFPDLLGDLVREGLLDYVAMDIKTSPEKYSLACGLDVDFELVKKSAELLRSSQIDYEFRTTAVPGLVEREDIISIGEWLRGGKGYYLQQFVPGTAISEEYRRKKPRGLELLAEFAKIAEGYFLKVGVRGV